MFQFRSRHSVLSVAIFSLVGLVLWGCPGTESGEDVVTTMPSSSVSCDNATPPVALQLDCPALPNTIAKGDFVTDTANQAKYLDYDLFAWNSFIALNWPAEVPSDANGWSRGFPDLGQSFASAAPDALTVWETLKEKREVFIADPFTGHIESPPSVADWNAPPTYGPAGTPVPLCAAPESLGDRPLPEPDFERHLVATTKSPFDTEDETVEVASEARETDAVLCQGHSADCGISGTVVGPRVWKGQPNLTSTNPAEKGLPVVYEVKVNWDFYDYLKNFPGGPLWVQQNARTSATSGDIRLPARTSAQEKPYVPAGTKATNDPNPTRGDNQLVLSYSADTCSNYAGSTPCPAGSVHLKAAWLPISAAEAVSGKYHSALAYYYKNSGSQKCKMPQYFGLIGLHIIQRIHEQRFESDGVTPNPPAHPKGGTFIFASWEHVDNDTQGFTYANYGPPETIPGGPPNTNPPAFPNVDTGESAIPLYRVYDLLDTTKQANDLVHGQLGCSTSATPSVWCNYMLIGTQYQAAQLPDPAPTLLSVQPSTPLPNVEAPAGSGQPYYLANLVIESNLGLQQFQGVPPAFAPVDHFTMPTPPNDAGGGQRGHRGGGGGAPEIVPNPDGFHFRHDLNNLSWRIAPRVKDAEPQSDIHQNSGQFSGKKRGAWNMGGCMGCHGVAQSDGYSFSFVLLDNQAGGAPDSQTDFVIPPLPLYVE